MIRQVTVNLNYGNAAKTAVLRRFLTKYTIGVNKYVNLLWRVKRFSGNFVEKGLIDKVETNLSAAAKQLVARVALHIVKLQGKKKNKTKPVFKGRSFNLDQRFILIQDDKENRYFDLWITFRSLGISKSIQIPSRKHKHFNYYINNGWKLKQAGRIRVVGDKLYLNLFFEKDTPKVKEVGSIVGLDCGYNKLAVLSTSQQIGSGLKRRIDKIVRKKQNSKGFKSALKERNNYINSEIKKIPFGKLKGIAVEDLKDVRKNTKGKVCKEFSNRLQWWVYGYFLNRLRMTCEVVGVQLHKVNPAYTSRICSKCGDNHKENRVGELFLCRSCGYTADADYNASKNILNRFLREPTDSVIKTIS